MGNQCCSQRPEQEQGQQQPRLSVRKSRMNHMNSEDAFDDYLDTIRETKQEYSMSSSKQKQQSQILMSFGDKLIQEMLNLNDYAQTPLDEQWILFSEQGSDKQHLKVYGFEHKVNDKSTITIIRTEFRLNCTISKYVNQSIETMCAINKRIETLVEFEKDNQYEECKRYLSYKGIPLIMSSRDFVYYKKFKHISDRLYCEVAKSIEDNKYSVNPKKTRGTINIVGQVVEQLDSDQILIKQFIDVDYRTNVAMSAMSKNIVKEMQQYVQNVCKQMNNND